ncbi:fec operon regulator FecR [mine drainage metagenome]|uniref:Fec operon regulator FecR n=1 Tax=mine drainage metagenome TaxID=410659 RepID=A0A1J5T014_9ZZZZ
MSLQRIETLLARKLSGEASVEESKELLLLLQNHPQEQYLSELLQDYWDHPRTQDNGSEDDLLDTHFNHILETATSDLTDESNQKQKASIFSISPIIKRLSIAAVFLLVIGISWIFYSRSEKFKFNYGNEVYAKPGAKSKIILPDGTIVWLNSGSKLYYSPKFTDTIRSVALEGEAFFDVVKDAKHPFIVHTSGIDIRVLGTAFNVKSYESDPTIETTLIRGLIEVVKKNQSLASKVIVRPHEKLIFNKEDNTLTSSSINAEAKYKKEASQASVKIISKEIAIVAIPQSVPDSALTETAWIYNKLIVDGETFAEFAKKMERWYNVHIVFENPDIEAYRFHSVFEKESVEQALQALQLTASFNYKINDNEIEITEKK